MSTISALDVAKKAIEIALADPTNIYEPANGQRSNCQYVHLREDEVPAPGCLFGHALLELGVDPATIPEGDNITSVMKVLGIEPLGQQTRAILIDMNNAQESQDEGETWGDAVAPLVKRVVLMEMVL